jgi:hypothetical protein
MPEPWRAGWLVAGHPLVKRQALEPRPTLAELQRGHCWTWVYCQKCLHHALMALCQFDGVPTYRATARQRHPMHGVGMLAVLAD